MKKKIIVGFLLIGLGLTGCAAQSDKAPNYSTTDERPIRHGVFTETGPDGLRITCAWSYPDGYTDEYEVQCFPVNGD